MLHHLLDYAGDYVHVRKQQVVAAHARPARHAGGDDHYVRAGRIGVVVGADYGGVRAEDGPGLEHVEGFALGQPLDYVDQHHVGVALVEYALCRR